MKTRESGMPEESLWAGFFQPEEILRKLGQPSSGNVVDFGCGYGTFTIPAAKITTGTVHALDIDPKMVASAKQNAGLGNVRTCVFRYRWDRAVRRERHLRDVVQHPPRGVPGHIAAGGIPHSGSRRQAGH